MGLWFKALVVFCSQTGTMARIFMYHEEFIECLTNTPGPYAFDMSKIIPTSALDFQWKHRPEYTQLIVTDYSPVGLNNSVDDEIIGVLGQLLGSPLVLFGDQTNYVFTIVDTLSALMKLDNSMDVTTSPRPCKSFSFRHYVQDQHLVHLKCEHFVPHKKRVRVSM